MKIFIITLILVVFLSACSGQKHRQPNILWITCEDISPAWGCYGDKAAVTPNIDELASQGYIFTHAFSNAPISAPARSTLITGMYATSLGTQNLRSEITIPEEIQTLPELMGNNGYYTTNNFKTDYNFNPEGMWDENGTEAHWRNKPDNKPFFSVFNFMITHEGHANEYNEEDTRTLSQLHDPDSMDLPPYYPDTEEFHKIMAHQYDLISVFDQEVGKLVDQLKKDGLYENTIIFVFSDHGFGLPRYKRWLYNTGIQVPFVMFVPEKFKNKVANLRNMLVDQAVGFVDFAPTVLNLAGAEIPEIMEGKNFLGDNAISKDYIFGYRDRADDAYDMSRSIYNGQYMYIRNYMPQKPYIQNALIFKEDKRSYKELLRLKTLGELPEETMKMFEPKPPEELYDLMNDPQELNNLINDPDYREIVSGLHEKLKEHMVKTHDTGLMNEGDMMVRAGGGSVYEMAHDSGKFNPAASLEAAELAGKFSNIKELYRYLHNDDPAVRFWALNAIDAYNGDISKIKDELLELLDDNSVPNKALAAEILIKRFNEKDALSALEDALRVENEVVLLQVAISVRNIGDKAMPLIPVIKNEVYPRISGDIWGRYKSWSYPMFIGMALDQTLINCGIMNQESKN
jgi:N-sulfoglucosamine sulfohydrolase